MKKFLLLYPLTLAILFVLFYWETSSLATLINTWQVNLSSELTRLTLAKESMEGNRIFITPTFALIIDKACNGLIPYFFFLASIIAFPSTLAHKIKWAILGYLLLSLLNVFRIWFITQMVMLENSNFSLAHDYMGNMLLVLSALVLFIAFIKTRPL